MGGDHTFNGTRANCCGGNRNAVAPRSSRAPAPRSWPTPASAAATTSSRTATRTSPSPASTRSTRPRRSAAAPAASSSRSNFAGFDATASSSRSPAPGCTPPARHLTGTGYTDARPRRPPILAVTGAAADGHRVRRRGRLGRRRLHGHLGGEHRRHVPTARRSTPTAGARSPASPAPSSTAARTTNGGAADGHARNHSPVVTAPADKTIPTRTPFTLTGSAHGLRRRRADLPVGADRRGRPTGTGSGRQHQDRRPAVPAVRDRRAGQRRPTRCSTTRRGRTWPAPRRAGPSRTWPRSWPATPTPRRAPARPRRPPAPVPQATVDCFSEFLPTAAGWAPATRGAALPADRRATSSRPTRRRTTPAGVASTTWR